MNTELASPKVRLERNDPPTSKPMTRPNESTARALLRAFLPSRPLHWVGVAATLAVVGGAGGFAFAASGLANLSAVPPHPVGWAHLLHFASTRSFAAHDDAPRSEEPLDSNAMIARGAAQYAVVCSNCHGAPGYGQSPLALSMRPEPPQLPVAEKTYTDGELFFVVKNGVRYTSMPAWPVQNRNDEVWAMVAFLKAMPGMDRETYTRLAIGDAGRAEGKDGAVTKSLDVAAPDGDRHGRSEISPFVPTNTPRPYLPGDPQDPYSGPAATQNPRTGFSTVALGSDALTSCTSCHSADGAGRADAGLPNLTLQSPQYIYDALNAFAIGQRQSGTMWEIASSLTDAQMRAAALKFGAAAPIASHTTPVADAAPLAAAGALIAHGGVNPAQQPETTNGLPPAKVERCTSCHMQGTYLDKVIPRIDGQNAAYLRMQMHAFRAGGRGDTSSYNPMVDDSHNLTDAEITALAEYYSKRLPMPKK